jgi:hypothetical protein
MAIPWRGEQERPASIEWPTVQAKLEKTESLWSLGALERSGGEADVVGYDETPGETGRNYAVDLAAAMGIEILTEDQYRMRQELETFGTRTSNR